MSRASAHTRCRWASGLYGFCVSLHGMLASHQDGSPDSCMELPSGRHPHTASLGTTQSLRPHRWVGAAKRGGVPSKRPAFSLPGATGSKRVCRNSLLAASRGAWAGVPSKQLAPNVPSKRHGPVRMYPLAPLTAAFPLPSTVVRRTQPLPSSPCRSPPAPSAGQAARPTWALMPSEM